MSEYEFTVSLRIRHPSIEPSRITETLGIEPQHTWKAGEARHDLGSGCRSPCSPERISGWNCRRTHSRCLDGFGCRWRLMFSPMHLSVRRRPRRIDTILPRPAESDHRVAETISTTRASRYFPVPSSRSNRRRSTGLTRCSSKPASRARRTSSG
jgi:hypothetical protein